MKRREENFEEFKKSEANQGTFKNGMQRLYERETCFLRIAHKEQEGETKHRLEEKRKKEMLEYNMKIFGRVTIGVHGKELPKYSEEETNKEWWKQSKGYTQNPHYQSAKLMHQDHKFWAKPDEMFLADTKVEAGPVDPFKTVHKKSEKKSDVMPKVTQLSHFNPGDHPEIDGPGIKQAHNCRWTTIENQFTRKKKRLFDELPIPQDSRGEKEPLYSSFNPKGVFIPPPSSKDIIVKQSHKDLLQS